jgi:CRP-like cAMP-binding protein
MIVAGRVELLKDGRAGSVRVGLLGKGELLGEMGVLDQGPRNTSARADTMVKVEVIPRDEFLRMIESEPQAAIKIMTRMAKRLRDSDEKLAESGDGPKTVQAGSALATTSAAKNSPVAKAGAAASPPAEANSPQTLVPLPQIDPQSLPVQHLPSAASLQRPGLLDRLVGVFKGGKGRIRRPRTVAITALSLEAERFDPAP